MKKTIWIILAAISLIVSVIANSNATKFETFVISSLFWAAILFGVIVLVIKAIDSFKNKNLKKFLIFFLCAIPLILLVLFGYILVAGHRGVIPTMTPPHFRTNILTGQCEYGGGAANLVRDPWYYKPDCDYTKEEKIEFLKRKELYGYMAYRCELDCNKIKNISQNMNTSKIDNRTLKFYSNMYCSGSASIGISNVNSISCNDLASCDAVSCG